MTFGSRRTFLGTMAIAVACVFGSATAARQLGPVQNGGQSAVMTEEVFKSVVLLRGISVDTFFDAMGMFANAMGADCTYCHSSVAAFDRAAFAEPTPRIMRARQMITMMNALNKTYFGGQPRVTCFTCHGGNSSPPAEPNLALQYGPIVEDPNAREFAPDTITSADAVFDKYLEAVGGRERLAGLSSFIARGTYAGFDTGFEEVAVEIFAKAPNQHTKIVHMDLGESVSTFDGANGWRAGPDTPVPLLTLTGGNLDRARLEALVWFPAGLRQAFNEWRVGRVVLNDEEVQIIQASESGQAVANLYFDDSGLLVRLVRWSQTPVGLVPTQIDYADYREVAGVQMPFLQTITQTYMQTVVELSDVQPNAAIDAARFARPAPARRPS